jgi:8-oxo-dGTP pyrophosphatase MutT (NUDIX family)
MNITNAKSNVCNNCGKYGHLFHQCRMPITSYGIIAFRKSEHGLQYLMIRRKDSFGYIDFIRGKYSSHNIEQIQKSVNEMSLYEKDRLQNSSFDILWRDLWGDTNGIQYRGEEVSSSKKFESIKTGVQVNNSVVNLSNIIRNSDTSWTETEWEFPKGRRNMQEKDIDCALREFQEETGYNKDCLDVIVNLLPFEETFIGSNHKSYKHKFFLAFMNDAVDTIEDYQKTEVSKLEWKTFNECLECIRPYHLEKKQMITNINYMLENYRIYS